ncbi:MAG: hypothetical protein A3E85_00945 [Gammaproteobacteria bacterium RIFCSPHIGHO2_12_FULL_45_12]|nr:MAG: hypothetical protein A3E85_00945 [Gammaproteobacteria bacterium RIFCSPHIGHO2_12_FULL_45_12]
MIVPDVQINHATLSYQGKYLFNQLSLPLGSGQWVGLLGPSGVGKTSLLRLIAGLTLPNEASSSTITTSNQLPIQQQIAYMPQADSLLPWLSVLDNAALGLALRPAAAPNRLLQKKQAHQLLHQVGLGASGHLYPGQLSGGMRQRVALIRTLLENKPIILMDEPFSAVDAITRYQLQTLAATLLKGKTVLFITHDPAEALRLANVIYLMQGHPATLTAVTTLSSQTPRELSDPDIAPLQAHLQKALFMAKEAST